MLADARYRVRFVPENAVPDKIDDFIDVEVLFNDGRRYVGTFFTMDNLRRLFDRYRLTGECSNGLYLWASDMIIVERLTASVATAVVEELIRQEEFESAFGGPLLDPESSMNGDPPR